MPSGIYRLSLLVPPSAIDVNGHVNNVQYVHWMQDVAIAHADAAGGTDAARLAGATWVARSHHIEYLKPLFLGETLHLLTWISDLHRIRSLRKYLMVRQEDRAVIARGETEWVFVDSVTGRPKSIPDTFTSLFSIVSPDQEPRGWPDPLPFPSNPAIPGFL